MRVRRSSSSAAGSSRRSTVVARPPRAVDGGTHATGRTYAARSRSPFRWEVGEDVGEADLDSGPFARVGDDPESPAADRVDGHSRDGGRGQAGRAGERVTDRQAEGLGRVRPMFDTQRARAPAL